MEPTGTISELIVGMSQRSYRVSELTLVGFFWFFLGIWARVAYLSGQKAFHKIFQPREPSLKAEAAPLTVLLSGLWGGFKALVTGLCWWIFLAIGIDFVLFSGQATVWMAGLLGY